MCAVTVADLQVRWGADTREADRAFSEMDQKVEGSASRLGAVASSLTGLGQKLTVGMTLPLLGMGAAAFDAASDLGESMSKVNVVFDDAAGSVLAWGDTTAEAIGLSENAALAAAGTFGNLLTGMGLGQEAAAGMSMDMVQLAADLASFNNVPIAEALAAIQSGLVGEAEPMRRFGVLLNEASVQAQALEMGLWDGTGALTEQAKVLARQALIMEQTGNAQGDFARTSEGAANSMRVLTARLGDLSPTLGAVLLPIGIRIIGWLTDAVAWVDQLSPHMQQLVVIGGALAAELGPVLTAIGMMAPGIAALSGAFALLLGPVGLIVLALGALGVAYARNLFGFRDAVHAVGRAVLPILRRVGAAIAAVAGFGGLLVDAFQAGGLDAVLGVIAAGINDLFGPDVTRVAVTFLRGIFDAARLLGDAFRHLATLVGAAFRGDWTTASVALLGILQSLGQAAVALAAGLGGALLAAFQAIDWAAVGSALWAGFQAAMGWLVGTAGPWVGAQIAALGALIVQGFRSIPWGEVWQFVLGGLQQLAAWLAQLGGLILQAFQAIPWGTVAAVLWEGLSGAFGWLVGTALPWLAAQGAALIASLWGGMVAFWNDTLGPWLGSLPELAVDLLGDLTGWLVDKGKALLSGLWDGLVAVWDEDVKPWLAGLPGKAVEAICELGGILEGKGREILSTLYTGLSNYWTYTLVPWFEGLPDSIVRAFEGLATGLWNAGAAGIQALADGIWSKVSVVGDAIGDVADEIARRLPGSDAEIGPLSHLTASARSLPETLAAGMLANTRPLAVATDTLAAMMLPATSGGALAFGAGGAFGGGTFALGAAGGGTVAPVAPVVVQGGGGGGDVHWHGDIVVNGRGASDDELIERIRREQYRTLERLVAGRGVRR